MREEAGEVKLVFWSELKKVSDCSKTKASSSSIIDSLTVNEIDTLIRQTRISMLKRQAINCQKRKKVDDLLKVLAGVINKKQALKSELKSLKMSNKNMTLMINYGCFLR
jgi:hypothetical protein